jgi:hypothetical protein
MVNLEQIKADIAARKAMPAWGPSIERIRTINATLPSFSLKTVEALVEMLESCNRTKAANDVIQSASASRQLRGSRQNRMMRFPAVGSWNLLSAIPMEAESYWPADWYDDSFKPKDTRRNLIKAAALIIAKLSVLIASYLKAAYDPLKRNPDYPYREGPTGA